MSGVVINTTGPGFVIPTLTNKSPLYVTHTVVGIILMTVNLLFLAMVISQWKFARKWPLFFGMFAANIINGMHNFVAGIYHLLIIKNGSIDELISGWYCMLTMTPSLWIMGITFPATLQLLIGIERVTAIVAFQWFSLHWNSRKLWYATGISYLCTVAAFVVPSWWFAFSEHFVARKECFIPEVVKYIVLALVMWYSITASVVGVVLTISALLVGWARSAKSNELFKRASRKFGKQIRLTKQLSAVALVDLLLVTVPNVLSTFPSFGLSIPAELDSYNPVLTSLYCVINMCIYICVHKDFRLMIRQFLKNVGASIMPTPAASHISKGRT